MNSDLPKRPVITSKIISAGVDLGMTISLLLFKLARTLALLITHSSPMPRKDFMVRSPCLYGTVPIHSAMVISTPTLSFTKPLMAPADVSLAAVWVLARCKRAAWVKGGLISMRFPLRAKQLTIQTLFTQQAGMLPVDYLGWQRIIILVCGIIRT